MLPDRSPKSGGSTGPAPFGDTVTTNMNKLKNGQMLGIKEFRLKVRLNKRIFKDFLNKKSIKQNKKLFSDF